MSTNYETHRQNVLSLNSELNKAIGDLDVVLTNSSLSEFSKSFGKEIRDINNTAEKVSNGFFRILVAGEAKSGKSTFINAYLGTELLPMDENQCTSSIIEIRYGEAPLLKVTYADERTEEYNTEEGIRLFLKQHAALSDDYREIPVPAINYGLLSRCMGNISEEDISKFISSEEIVNANIYGQEASVYSDNIRKYIVLNKDNWQNIVTRLELCYPLPNESFRDIEIVDSPGVGAKGALADITGEYLRKADSIIFLKSIVGADLGSKSFDDFMQTAKNKCGCDNYNLFLMLSHCTSVTSASKAKLLKTAKKMFGSLPEQHIIPIDSKAMLYANMFSQMETLDDIRNKANEMKKAESLDNFAHLAVLEAKDKTAVINTLREMAGFENVMNALDEFGRGAHYRRLKSLLGMMSGVCGKAKDEIRGYGIMLKEKSGNPEAFVAKADLIRKELEELQNKMSDDVDRIVAKYTADNGIVATRLESSYDDFEAEMQDIDSDDSDAFELIEDLALREGGIYNSICQEIKDNMLRELDGILGAVCGNLEIPELISKPYFSEEDFENIKEETADEGWMDIMKRKCGKSVKDKSVYSREKHAKAIKLKVSREFDKIKNGVYKGIIEFTREVGVTYRNELSQRISTKTEELYKICQEAASAEDIVKKAETLGAMIPSFEEIKRKSEIAAAGIES